LGDADEGLNCFCSSFDRKRQEVNAELSRQGISERFRVLSRREAEVCSLVVRRLTSAKIGAWLFVSTRTVEKHIQNVFDKLEVHSREQLRWRPGTNALLGAYPLVQRPISR
jgi:DNA-binding NarL/FixJ family response regulator